MRCAVPTATTCAVLLLAATASAQHTMDYPTGQIQPYFLDSGARDNGDASPRAVFGGVVRMNGAGWLRLYFGDAKLERGTFIRIRSLADGEVQELDASALARWGYSSAYFNGDAVRIELVAGGRTKGNRVLVDRVAVPGPVPVGGAGECGICGGADDRVASSEDWSARLLPAGCTASVFSTDSCMVSAGHCLGGNMVVEFNVPPSNSNCSINHPPVADQFPIVDSDGVNGGVGNDWSVLMPGNNNVGQKPYARYGELRPIAAAPANVGQTASVWGFGADSTCTQSQTQRTSSGQIVARDAVSYEYSVDITGGNSGSSLIVGGQIVGIVTHCSFGGCPNFGTRSDLSTFAAARAALCSGGGGTAPANDLCQNAIHLGNGDAEADFDTTAATSGANGAPFLAASCNQFGDSPGILSDLWWTWTAPTDGEVRIHTCGGGLDTKLALYDSTVCPPAAGSEIACSDDGDCPNGGSASDVTVLAGAGETLLIRVGRWGTDGGGQGEVGPGTLFVEYTAAGACCIATSCQVRTPASCAASGGVYHGDGVACGPSTCAPPEGACCLPLGTCQVRTQAQCSGSGGTYQGDGSVCAGQCPPVNDQCGGAIYLGNDLVEAADFNNTNATNGANGAPLLAGSCNQFGDSPGILNDLWWTWTAPVNGTARFHTCGSALDTKMAVYTSACTPAAGSEVGCSDDGDCPVGEGAAADVTLDVSLGTTYLIRVGQWGTDGGAQGPVGSATLLVEIVGSVVTGACCTDGGATCAVTAPSECVALGGVYLGVGTTCAAGTCADATGACCLGDGTCIESTQNSCLVFGGTYFGGEPCASQCSPPCPWDLDGSGEVGVTDLLGLLAAWGTNPAGPPDFDGNGDVAIPDLLVLLGNWGLCP